MSISIKQSDSKLHIKFSTTTQDTTLKKQSLKVK